MFDIFKRKKKPADDQQEAAETELNETEPQQDSTAVDAESAVVEEVLTEEAQAPVAEMPKAGVPASDDTVFFQESSEQTEESATEKKKGFFSRLASGLSKTRSGFSDGVANLLLGKKEIDDDLLEDLETQLVMADVGVEATREIMAKLTERVGRKELTDSDALFEALIKELQDVLAPCEQPLVIDSGDKPYVILMVGINGVGKTTTIGKLAKQFQAKGKSVMLAAGDTFRAAAVEQLQVWGERNDVPVVAQHTGADSASVLFDALEAATARGTDILIADTAGRLHTKDNLMGELEKVVRVMKKIDPEAPHEVMLVLDAGTGQNALNQATQFQKSVGVTGLTLTKLDGTAKGGVIFALAKQLGLPVRFIGIGEGINDLRPFDANDFTRALFNKEN
ncbi:MAG TPA: signal recognition particle-docking protein FtsY [Oceanospirillales bacterium]|nr:signal recognition particle-docking protein FtsY [Oleispira sp.]HCM05379.1 signal recognition particle-docking protein FtsY [Oceanospirillales bacterium]|tara:strand:- start:89 stop:1270 length:1182 start_codon:yes stop_codon:yes gene_type:complete